MRFLPDALVFIFGLADLRGEAGAGKFKEGAGAFNVARRRRWRGAGLIWVLCRRRGSSDIKPSVVLFLGGIMIVICLATLPFARQKPVLQYTAGCETRASYSPSPSLSCSRLRGFGAHQL